jgi:hypothetical protein
LIYSKGWKIVLKKKNFVIVVDEFQRLGSKFASALQFFYDSESEVNIKFDFQGTGGKSVRLEKRKISVQNL